MVIVVFGLPGSGKSFFASHLAKSLGAQHISSDQIRRQIFDERTYTPDEKEKVYEVMLEAMKIGIRRKKHLVLDATFYKERIRKKFMQLAKTSDIHLICIEVRAEESLISQRLGKKRPYSEADYAVYLKVKEAFEPMKSEHLVLNSTQENIKEMVDKALLYIAEAFF